MNEKVPGEFGNVVVVVVVVVVVAGVVFIVVVLVVLRPNVTSAGEAELLMPLEGGSGLAGLGDTTFVVLLEVLLEVNPKEGITGRGEVEPAGLLGERKNGSVALGFLSRGAMSEGKAFAVVPV